MTTSNHAARLAAESSEKREARLQSVRVRHRQQQVMQAQLPLFQQSSVRTKILKFHALIATLDALRCSTCSERYPGLELQSHSTECLQCSRDKQALYSSTNNMDLYHLNFRLAHVLHSRLIYSREY